MPRKIIFSFFRDFWNAGPGWFEGNKRKILSALFGAALVFFSFYFYVLRAPAEFPVGEIVEIPSGISLDETAKIFRDKKAVRSSGWLRSLVIIFGGEKKVYAGEYFFNEKKNLLEVSFALARGKLNSSESVVLIPEGKTLSEISEILDGNLDNFDKNMFLEKTKGMEGYLFPDTYFLPRDIKTEKVIKIMRSTFDERVKKIGAEIKKFGRSLKDVVIMASILEGEARRIETKRKIAGILWKRLGIGMPLQSDATFLYINGKTSAELTKEDLNTDSPYNTYRYKGLPPTPINNPGLDSILASVTPADTKYFYFLSDRNGNMHYATTFEEHKKNKEKYLR